MKFTPRSDEEIESETSKFGPWPAGTYDFEVADAADQVSKAGNEMLVLTLSVFNTEGERRTVYDYLLESIAYKLKHAAEACGLHDNYARGDINKYDFFGKTGRLQLRIQPAKDGYAAKNVVRDYVPARPVPASVPARRAAMHAGRDIDDEIPF